MRQNTVFFVLIGLLSSLLAIGAAGCATIFSDGGDDRPLTVSSDPRGATVYVRQGSANWQAQGGTTPTTVYLDPTGGADYSVKVELDGYEAVTAHIGTKVDPWFFGSIGLVVLFVIPGLVATGVDLATGAWKKLGRDHLHVELKPAG
jgi:hypothetical protein